MHHSYTALSDTARFDSRLNSQHSLARPHSYSRATVDAYDASSDSYTLRLDSGKMKYSVEPEEMRRIQAGDFRVGDAASVYRTDGTWAPATIDDYDDRSCSTPCGSRTAG